MDGPSVLPLLLHSCPNSPKTCANVKASQKKTRTLIKKCGHGGLALGGATSVGEQRFLVGASSGVPGKFGARSGLLGKFGQVWVWTRKCGFQCWIETVNQASSLLDHRLAGWRRNNSAKFNCLPKLEPDTTKKTPTAKNSCQTRRKQQQKQSH